MCNVRGVSARKHYVAREDVTHDVAIHVGHILLADVENVERKSGGPVRVLGQDERQRVTNPGYGLRVVDRQLTTVVLGNRCRVPPDALTACAPVGSSRKREPSLPVGSCARARPAMIAESATLKRSRLIDQHDWDVVTDGIAQPTLVTEKGLLRLSILEFALALRANEDFEEARRQGHLLFPVAS
jgi:hypothetical protein